jgi:hypothetical protein
MGRDRRHAQPKAVDRRISRIHRFETAHRAAHLFELSMVGLDDVVEIFALSLLRVRRALAFSLQISESGGVGRRLVGVDDLRLLPILGIGSCRRTLLRKLGTYNRKSLLYRAFRELGRVERTLFLPRFISRAEVRRVIRAETTKIETYNDFLDWVCLALS